MTTRIQKYKEYRTSIYKQGSISEETIQEYEGKHLDTSPTMTLPLKEVMDTVEEDERKNNQRIRHEKIKTTKIIVTIAILTAVLVGIILFAIFAFGRME